MSLTLPPTTIEKSIELIERFVVRQQNGIASIGIFDSGVGGLTVLPALTENGQNFDLYYRGDTAHFPYGEKTADELVALVVADIEYVASRGCSLVGIACNTASIVWREIIAQLPPNAQKLAALVVFDTISSVIQQLDTLVNHQVIGIIGTHFTVTSGAYEQAIRAHFEHTTPIILQSAEQPLVAAIERGEQAAIDQELDRIFNYFNQYNLDVFILGCTHYGHIAPKIAALLPSSVQMLDPSVLLGKALRLRLTTFGGEQLPPGKVITDIAFTGETA